MRRVTTLPARSVHPHERGDDSLMRLPQQVQMPVHPHERGDDSRTCKPVTDTAGSPPRAWGRLASYLRTDVSANGSPPRAWGRRSTRSTSSHDDRFTPTRVGTACRVTQQITSRRFTPTRVGTSDERCTYALTGSPPRAWGRRCMQAPRARAVGSPPRAWGRRADQRVGSRNVGSPPRAWGRPLAIAAKLAAGRFTPTRVGTTRLTTGLSHGRFTPTRVGTRPHLAALRRLAVHPHARGDDACSSR